MLHQILLNYLLVLRVTLILFLLIINQGVTNLIYHYLKLDGLSATNKHQNIWTRRRQFIKCWVEFLRNKNMSLWKAMDTMTQNRKRISYLMGKGRWWYKTHLSQLTTTIENLILMASYIVTTRHNKYTFHQMQHIFSYTDKDILCLFCIVSEINIWPGR